MNYLTFDITAFYFKLQIQAPRFSEFQQIKFFKMNEENVYFIKVDDVTVSSTVIDEYFQCDLEKCKGACCTIPNAYGAPITFEEANILVDIQEKLYKYLPEKHIQILQKYGPYEVHKGFYHTRTFEDKECVFVYYDGDIAKCAIEKAYLNGEIDFRKPISCHLFPIRKIHFGNDVLRAEFLSICEAALSRGLDSKMPVYEFCKESLIRLYGKRWFDKLKQIINQLKR
jgi:hypothetical protein